MFELSKKILEKVSFDKALFRKELTKSFKWIKPEEKILLLAWSIHNFGQQYQEVIMDVYKSVG
jgi:hypothetical protein